MWVSKEFLAEFEGVTDGLTRFQRVLWETKGKFNDVSEG